MTGHILHFFPKLKWIDNIFQDSIVTTCFDLSQKYSKKCLGGKNITNKKLLLVQQLLKDIRDGYIKHMNAYLVLENF